jgi:immune inhibitor A
MLRSDLMSKKKETRLPRFVRILALGLALLGADVAGLAFAAAEISPDPMPPHPDLQELADRGLVVLPDAVTNPEVRRLLGINEVESSLPVKPSGTWRALALLVEFTDNPASVGASFFDTLLFSTGDGTLKDYYDEVSYGILDIVTVNLPSSVGWMTMPRTYAYYVDRSNGFGAYPQNAQRLAEDAVRAADPVVDYSRYDNDADGWVDSLFIIHAGPGAEFTGEPSHIWSHKWSMVDDPFADGVWLDSYTMEPEYWEAPGDMTVGVYAHELAHTFGLPDLYDPDGSSRGIGDWGLLGGGGWNGSLGSSPAWPSAWSRALLGWVNPTNLAANQTGVGIPAAETSQTVYRLWTNGAIGSEYFLVENRQPVGYDAALPGFGLLVWHIDEGKPGNEQECDQLNNWDCGTAHLSVALEQSDGLRELERGVDGGDAGDPFPGNTNGFYFDFGTVPNSSSYSTGLPTCVGAGNIGPSSPTMIADLSVSCDPGLVGSVVYQSHSVDDDSTGNSSGNADGFADCGETIELFVVLSNSGADSATDVNATISTSDPYVTFLFNTISSYGDIGGGASATNSDDFDFTIDPATPHGHLVDFDLDVTATNGGPWSSTFNLLVFCLSPDAFEPDDDSASANPITSGIPQTHNIYPVGDEDWVTFTVTKESEIVLETSGPSGDTRMWLYDASLTQLEFDDDDGGVLFSKIDRVCDLDPLAAGTYYAKIDEFGDNDPIEEYDISYTWTRPCVASTVALISDQSELSVLTPILDDMGLTYDVFDNNWNGVEGIYTSNSALLSDYKVVVWYASGFGSGRLTTQQEHDKLESYLQSGGHLLVTGYDTLGSPTDPLLADLIRSNDSGDGPFTADFVITDGGHPITSGPFGSFPASTGLVAGHTDHDQAEADTSRGAVAVAELSDGHDKITAAVLPTSGIVVYWNGNFNASDWVEMPAPLAEAEENKPLLASDSLHTPGLSGVDDSPTTFPAVSVGENVAMLKNTLYWLSLGPLVYDSHLVDDDDTGDSIGNGDGGIDCGETVELFVDLLNQGTEVLAEVDATISTADPLVVFLFNTTSTYGSIAAGGSATNLNDFDFSVDPATPDGHLITFDLDITAASGGTWSDSFTVTADCSGTLEGRVELQGRGDHTGAEVCAWDGGALADCATTDATGHYDLSLPQDTYDIVVEMELYLDSTKAGVAITADDTTALSDLVLKGGDSNDDDIVNILDLSLTGGRYSLNCGDPGFDARADINNNCTVNIQDIVLCGSNFGSTSPVPWP